MVRRDKVRRQLSQAFCAWFHRAAPSLVRPPTPPLRPVMTANTSFFRITATAGTKFVEAYFFGGIIISPNVRLDGSPQRHRLVYDPKAFFLCPPRIRLDQACAHCPKFLTAALGAGALFNSGVAVRSHKPAGDRRFGRPLPIANFLIPGRIDLRRSSLFLAHPFRDGMLHPCAALSGIEIPDRRVDCSPLLTRTPGSRMGKPLRGTPD